MTFHHTTDLDTCNKKVKRLTHCIEIANLINSELSIDRLLTHIMETARKTFTADSVSLLLKEDKTGDLVFYIAIGKVGNEIRELFRVKKDQGIAGYVARTGTPLNLKDAYDHPGFSKEYDRATGYRTRAMLCAPLKTRGKTLGVIQILNKLSPPGHFTGEELEMLVTISSSAAVAIDTARMHQAILQKETLERDLKLAREVQQSFLPSALPRIPGYLFAGLNHPALEIGGDFYNCFHLRNNRLGIVLGDVSGKGIAASLFMARLTSDLHYHCLRYPQPCQLLEQVNTLLCTRAQQGMFVTLVYMVLDTGTGRIVMSNAGHLPPVLTRKKTIRLLGDDAVKGPPLGILPDIQFAQEEWDLDYGDMITLYTDGITEAKNPSRQLFGIDRLMETLHRHRSLEPEILVQHVADAVKKFTRGQALDDDLTLLSFRINQTRYRP
ncbi:MAG: SpoIIE family protein phosphatase [Desulfotignum sp.]|nr:SpoIIE family protein phosphatase [Desulfotignum sp.]